MTPREVVDRFDALREHGDHDGARELISGAVGEYPDDLDVRFRVAEASRDARDWDTAVDQLERILQDFPNATPQVFLRLAEAHRFSQDFGSAVEVAAEGRRCFPDYGKLARIEAELAMSIGDWSAAIVVLEQLETQLDAASPSWLFVRLAASYRGHHDLAASASAILRGLRRCPEDPRLLEERAELAMAAMDWDLAVRRWQSLEAALAPGLTPAMMKRFKRARERQASMAASVESVRTADRPLLRRGWFRYAGAGVWSHWRANLPDHLKRTKPVGNDHLADDTVTGRFCHRWRRARRGFWANGTTGVDILITTSDGAHVLIDSARRQVMRKWSRSESIEEQRSLRDRLARHVAVPDYSVSDAPDGLWIKEQLVVGRHLDTFEPSKQVAVTRRLILQYADLAEHEAESDPDEELRAVFDERVLTSCRPAFRSVLTGPEWVADAMDWPVTPAVGDPGMQNLIVSTGGIPTMVDITPVARRVFFHDAICAIGRYRATATVREAFLDGEMDHEFGKLFNAAGVDVPVGPELRRWVLATVMMMRGVGFARRRGRLDRQELARRAALVHALVGGV